MRADRLLSLMMLLQARGRMTTGELAEELEVSQRTIYRDIDALNAAGVPIYGEPGPGGGYALLDTYRTDLTGLTEGEVRALFMLSIPEALVQLGVGQDLRAAMLKLAAALPAALRGDEERVRQRIHIDSSSWSHPDEPVGYLRTIHRAVWEDHRLHLTYRFPFGIEVTHLVEPYGLVAKGGDWYLVYGRDGTRVHRVADLADVQMGDEPFERPADFDLVAEWERWCAVRELSRTMFPVTIHVAPELIREMAGRLGDHIASTAVADQSPDGEGWIKLELRFESLEAARECLLGLGGAVEVLEPLALRLSVADYAAQTVAVYSDSAQR
jgi:predicted DNA-binding transcriptional regulator YafY